MGLNPIRGLDFSLHHAHDILNISSLYDLFVTSLSMSKTQSGDAQVYLSRSLIALCY